MAKTISKHRVSASKKAALKRLGLTPDAYNALLEAQGYVCKICRRPDMTGNALSVDHDHKTGRVRGLLCNKCNPMLGFAEDSPTILLRAIQYLKGNLL